MVEALERRVLLAATQVAQVVVAGDVLDPGEQVTVPVTRFTVAFTANVTNAAAVSQWALTRDGQDASAAINTVTYAADPPAGRYEATVNLRYALDEAQYALTARGTILDDSGQPLDGDADGTPGGDFVRAFSTAEPLALGPAYEVSPGDFPSGNYWPAMAMDDAGNAVVIWQNEGLWPPQVYAQRYDADGLALGAPIPVTGDVTHFRGFLSVAMDSDGDFVVAWQGYGSPSTAATPVYARRYDRQGVPQGDAFQVSTPRPGMVAAPKVAMDDAGNFMVAWAVYDGTNPGTNYRVYARRYDAQGVARGAEFAATSASPYAPTLTYNANNFTLGMDAAGAFVVAWTYAPNSSGAQQELWFRLYDAQGQPCGAEQRVTPWPGYKAYPTVAMEDDGNFVVAYESSGEPSGSVQVRWFDAQGVARSPEILLAPWPDVPMNPAVAVNAAGETVVTWTDYNTRVCSGQRFDAPGHPAGGSFLVANGTSHDIWILRAIAMDADGDFTTAWEYGSANSRIMARRFGDPPRVSGVWADGRAVGQDEQLGAAVTQFTVAFDRDVAGAGQASAWSLARRGQDVSGLITGVTYAADAAARRYEATVSLAAPLGDGDYALTARDAIANAHAQPLDGDTDGLPGGDFVRPFGVSVPDTTAPALVSALSRKTHGSAGDFDLPLSLTGTTRATGATVEPRKDGPTQLVFNFAEPIAAVDGLLDGTEFQITNATFASGSIAGSALTLNLTGVVNTKYVTVSLQGLSDLAGNALAGDIDVTVGALYGDIDQSGSVNLLDFQRVKLNLLQPLTASNFLADLDGSGSVNLLDFQVIKLNLLKGLS